jgi:hypothetical protein
MYLVAVGWLYVALMMAAAELVHPTGSALGALVTFVLYGALPVSLLMYLMATPLRKKARLRAELAAAQALAGDSIQASTSPAGALAPNAGAAHNPIDSGSGREPDAGSHSTGAAAVTPVGKEV